MQAHSRIRIEAGSVRPRLLLPCLISAILHLVVLSQINWEGLHAKLNEQHRLTVSLVPQSLPDGHISHVDSNRKNDHPSPAKSAEMTTVLDANESNYSLDMNQIRNQVREYAKQEFASGNQNVPLYGDYYGTYTGDDSGVFFFHLDASGQASGSAESKELGIVLLITGNITPSGGIHMIGKRNAAQATLSGQLNTKTGKVSGSWFMSGPVDLFAEGLFSGQRE